MGNDWKKGRLKPNDTMGKAIQILDQISSGVILVEDEQHRLLGTLTSGDIRRALICHCLMDTPIRNIMYKEPTTATVHDDRDAILSMMQNKGLLQVPILDEQGHVVGLETLLHLFEKKRLDNPVFLMAGGFGKRLRPLTNNIPKPLLKVGSKPILETIIEQFIEAGFYRFYISTHYKAEMVREYFGSGEKWGVEIEYVYEEEPLGTAGALGLLPDDLPQIPLIMMNGDLLTKVNFEQLLRFHLQEEGGATMCVREYDFRVPYGVVESDGADVTRITEKPVHKFFVNAGIYVLNPRLVKAVDGLGYLDMPNLLETHIAQNEEVKLFPLHEYWLDIGHMKEYERANQEVSTFEKR